SRWAVLQSLAPEPHASARATTWSIVALETVEVHVSSKSDCQEPESGWQSEPVSTSVPSRRSAYWRAVQPFPTLDQWGNRLRSYESLSRSGATVRASSSLWAVASEGMPGGLTAEAGPASRATAPRAASEAAASAAAPRRARRLTMCI